MLKKLGLVICLFYLATSGFAQDALTLASGVMVSTAYTNFSVLGEGVAGIISDESLTGGVGLPAAIYTPLLPASTDVLDITLSGISATSIVYPSPFNSTESSVTIAYRHTVDETIKIYIADISGRIVKTITTNSGTTRSADGYSRETWAGDSAFGGTVPSGVYVVQITAGGKVVTKTKVIVLR